MLAVRGQNKQRKSDYINTPLPKKLFKKIISSQFHFCQNKKKIDLQISKKIAPPSKKETPAKTIISKIYFFSISISSKQFKKNNFSQFFFDKIEIE